MALKLTKKDSKYLSWHRASLDYLSRVSAPSKDTKFDDRYILLSVIEKWRGLKTRPKLLPTRFERTHGLEPLTLIVEKKRLTTALKINPLMKQATGKKLRDQIESLLPPDERMLSTDTTVRKAIVYFLGRVVLQLPRYCADWLSYPKGLDYLTTALFTLYELDRITGADTDWLNELHKTQKEQDQTPDWEVLTLRPDGATSTIWSNLLNRFRSNIQSLSYYPLRKMCEYLRNQKGMTRVTGRLVGNICGLTRSATVKVASDMEMLLTERTVPSLSQMGLRYRIKFSRKYRGFQPLGTLCETLALSDTRFRGLRFYVESESKTEESEPNDITADQLIVSMRLDLFDTDNESWEPSAFEESEETPEDTPGWIYTESSLRDGDPVTLTGQDRYILGVLWSHQGSFAQREIFLSTMGVSKNRKHQFYTKMLKSNVVSIIHHPSMEYVGLPDGTVVAVRNASTEDIEDLTMWLVRSFPFVRLFRDLKQGCLLAVIRLPKLRSHFFASMIRTRLDGQGIENLTSTVMGQRTFYMTILNRLPTTQS